MQGPCEEFEPGNVIGNCERAPDMICGVRRERQTAQWINSLALAIPAVALNTVHAFRPDPQIALPMLIFTILFLVLTLVSLLRAVVRAERVTHDTIYGALSVYLLMAIAWAAAYLLLVTIHPGAIVMDAARHPSHGMDWSDCVFYSFGTLTSQGYGDIVL